MLINSILLDLPLSEAEYYKLYVGIIFMTVFTLIFVIIYLMVGEEREEAEV